MSETSPTSFPALSTCYPESRSLGPCMATECFCVSSNYPRALLESKAPYTLPEPPLSTRGCSDPNGALPDKQSPRQVYKLTVSGRKRFREETARWNAWRLRSAPR